LRAPGGHRLNRNCFHRVTPVRNVILAREVYRQNSNYLGDRLYQEELQRWVAISVLRKNRFHLISSSADNALLLSDIDSHPEFTTILCVGADGK